MATASSCEEQEPVTIADRVFNQLREAILGGKMAPGQKISEPELARAYGISRGPLREAIGRLEACGLVVRRIQTDIPTIDELGLPPIIKELSMTKRGLVIFVGATGTGKSTSLAAILTTVG